ncbi:MAG TPA: aminodeoxychorismate synthase component I [Longimicrobium sp.]|nr:aminodeoxychorismate synthase component I [Longimicrobium sp.]
MDAPLVRLDSLDPRRGARSFRFGGFVRTLRADRAGEVVPVLRAVERAVADGLHAAGFVAYEAAPALDPALATRAADPRLPLAWFALFERREEAGAGEDGDAPDSAFELGEWEIGVAEGAYLANVERIRGLIAAGDTYQVNYTFPMRAPFTGDALALYRRMARAQRSAYCAFLDLGDGISIASASPELFFHWTGDALELRPMKGTRPRGRWLEEDAALGEELAASPKDRAENLMIVDLLRNDAGRVSEFGSVRVERLFEVERYETVHQMTSTIRARARPGTTLTGLFRALFPCGSVTGAPKVRTCEIVAELEEAPRGAYCGAIGYVSPGEAAFSVAIRTVVIDRDRGTAELGVGSGVTYDSDPAAEYRECLSKAAFTRRAPNDLALLETMRWEPGRGIALLDLHLERLAKSAAYFGFSCDGDAIRSRLGAMGGGEARTVRLRLHRSGEVEIGDGPPLAWDAPVRLVLARRAIASDHPWLYHKTSRREIYDVEEDSGSDAMPLLVNERGELTEAPIANVVLEIDGERWTPARESGLLPGVFREHLLRRGEVRERVLVADDLARASAVWVVNAVRGRGRAVVVGAAESAEPS